MLELSSKAFKQFKISIKLLDNVQRLYYNKEEIDDIYVIYREAERLKERVAAIGEAEEERTIQIFMLSVEGNTLIKNIIKRVSKPAGFGRRY